MKRCPTCDRTLDDTMTFCLVDGSVLSAPFDPRADESVSAPRNTDPGPTGILYPAPNTAEPTRPPETLLPLPQTIASPAQEQSRSRETVLPVADDHSVPKGAPSQAAMKTIVAPPPELMTSNENLASAGQRFAASESPETHSGGRKWLPLIAGVFLVVIIIGAILWFIRTKSGKESPGTAQSQPAQPAKPDGNKPPPTGQSSTENINGIQMQMVSVAGGTFLMGSPLSETGRDKDEGPQNDTTVPSFDMSKYEVTQAQYRAVMGTNPSSFKGDDRPVDSVSWKDAIEFCRKLSQLTGREYRLPTEAEWEFAARAGTSGPLAGSIDGTTWYGANAAGQTHPVGQKQPNGFGLYDMNGNVWEWCQSKYKPYPYNATDGSENLLDKDVRVMRGGAWDSSATSCRSAYRRRVIPDLRSVGFRVLRVLRR